MKIPRNLMAALVKLDDKGSLRVANFKDRISIHEAVAAKLAEAGLARIFNHRISPVCVDTIKMISITDAGLIAAHNYKVKK